MSAEDYRRLRAGATLSSTDSMPGMVARFLDRHGFPNPTPFASLAVFSQGIPTSNVWRAYGTVTGIVDVQRVVSDIVLVASDDIQDAALNKHPERFRAVDGTTEARITILERAATTASRHYAEARLGRALVFSDFNEFDTSGDFALNLEAHAPEK